MSPYIGSWLSLGSSIVAEIAADSGFDWLLFDLEHGCATDAALPDQLRALRGTQTKAIVRVGAPHVELIGRVLDWGADGIMVPRVSSAHDAEKIVRAAHFAPRGQRGVARTVRSVGYGRNLPDEDQMPRPLIFAQIETEEAVDAVEHIASVDGIDVLFIGPADLSFDLKARRSRRTYDECVGSIAQVARYAGKQTGTLLRTPDEVALMAKMGMQWIAVQSDITVLRDGYSTLLQQARVTQR